MARPKKRNPWTSVGEIVVWVLWAALLVPVGFAGWAVGHYTSLGKSGGAATVTQTVTTSETTTVTASGPAAPPPATTASSSTATPTTTTAAAGDPAKGKAVFASAGCAACHTFKPAGSSGSVGPDLDSAPAKDAKAAGMDLAAFVKQSIVDPSAYVPSGFAKGIMPTTFGSSLSSAQLDDLVAFVVAGSK